MLYLFYIYRVGVPFHSDRLNLIANPKWQKNAKNNNMRIVWSDSVLKINRKDGKVELSFFCTKLDFHSFRLLISLAVSDTFGLKLDLIADSAANFDDIRLGGVGIGPQVASIKIQCRSG